MLVDVAAISLLCVGVADRRKDSSDRVPSWPWRPHIIHRMTSLRQECALSFPDHLLHHCLNGDWKWAGNETTELQQRMHVLCPSCTSIVIYYGI